MSSKKIKQIKETIHYKVDELEDETTLHLLQEAVTAYTSPAKKDILDDLTINQKGRLLQSIQQANKGKTLSHEEIKQRSKKWLSK